MNGRKVYELLIPLSYLALVGVFVYLNFFADGIGDLSNIIVSIVMFVIVAVIFLTCERTAFIPVSNMVTDLKHVTARIRGDSEGTEQFLWNKYRSMGENLFTDETLRRRYRDFLRESDRVAASGKVYVRCELEDYINEDLTDEACHRGLLSQVPGALTGLGILGTFIGLSLGLQHFATESTVAITESIAPLMGGIKVAFYTSIYGMVFSLIFNYVFRHKLEDAEWAVRHFLDAYRSHVLPDAATDGMNLLLDLQRQQTEALYGVSNSMRTLLESQEMSELSEDSVRHANRMLGELSGVTEKLSAALSEASVQMSRIDAVTQGKP
ncbi:MAG: MotA/TolQ/ExbB proton channel family protein [Lachnospiraceae bacterium]|nr:MotA/TolQ/ExbB proton channel family protein [Lachnospiraceae bacterium]